jgi:RNA polymerase sigma-70 factor (ECF subfamily)
MVGALPSVSDVVAPSAAQAEARARDLVRDHFDPVWQLLRRLGVSDAVLDDAAQQVFIVATRKMDAIERGRERKYLFGIAVRVAWEARRAKRRRWRVFDESGAEHDAVDPNPNAEELVGRKQARERLDAILAEMAFELRVPFVLFELDGLTAPEIAEVLRIPAGTVASRLRRARTQFRERARRSERSEP